MDEACNFIHPSGEEPGGLGWIDPGVENGLGKPKDSVPFSAKPFPSALYFFHWGHISFSTANLPFILQRKLHLDWVREVSKSASGG